MSNDVGYEMAQNPKTKATMSVLRRKVESL